MSWITLAHRYRWPPNVSDCLCQAFDSVHFNEQAQEAFTILLRLINLSIGNASSYREVTKKPSILSELFNSSQQSIKDIGYRIDHILATFNSGASVAAAVGGPGGRHDDDFADFREISILPTADEILSQQPPFLRPSGVLEDSDGGETRAADYLDNTFRLLREEMINEMREELQTALGKKKRRHHGLVIDGVKLDGVYSGTKDRNLGWLGVESSSNLEMISSQWRAPPISSAGPISKKTPQALKLPNITLSFASFRESNRQFQRYSPRRGTTRTETTC
jgi:hypothetical protein